MGVSLLLGTLVLAVASAPDARFREANGLVLEGDAVAAVEIYRELAATGHESASLYWNWAQAAAARGELGQALWALQRGREIEPSDARLGQEIEVLREAASLDPAELTPEPLQALARTSRRWHLGLASLALLLLSLSCHAIARQIRGARWAAPAAWATFTVAACLAALPLTAGLARPTAVIVTADAPLFDAASTTAEAIATLREGEVVPVIETSGDYLRIEDSAGSRGWALPRDVWRLDRGPRPRAPPVAE